MTTFDSGGHQDLRSYIESNWQYLALIDSNGNEELRVDISGDSRTSWSTGSGSNPMTISGTFSGSDSDITTSVTLTRAELYKTSSATTRMANDSFTDATLDNDSDTLDLTIDVEVPNV